LKASVVVPLFQKAPYVRRCLESVAAQTMADFEVLVIDDGSTDGGGDVVTALGDPRFRLIPQENAGESAARNRGLLEARSRWVAFLDADDEWRPTFLEATLAQSEAHPGVVGVFTNVLDGTHQRPLLQPRPEGVVDDYFALVLEDQIGMTSMGTLARRDALLACGGFRAGRTIHEVGEDQDAFARLAWTGTVAYVPATLAIYHSEIPHGSTSRAREGRPEMPPRVLSYRELRASGRIPESLARSSRALCDHLLRDHAAASINFGCRAQALRTLAFECGPSAMRGWRFWSLLLRALLPVRAHARLRARFARPKARHEARLASG